MECTEIGLLEFKVWNLSVPLNFSVSVLKVEHSYFFL